MTHHILTEPSVSRSVRAHGATHDRNKGTRERGSEEQGKRNGGTGELVGHFAIPTYEGAACEAPAPSPLRPMTTLADIEAHDENRLRLGVLAHKRKPIALWRLSAWRCPVCQLDTVWDRDTDEWWNLGESDYGDAGSER